MMNKESSAKILVVDDEPDMVDLVRRKFRGNISEGIYSFLFAEDGYEALRILEAEPDIDLVVTDINMPRMDGLTLLTHLEEIAPLLRAVIVSAYGDMENIRTAMNRGAFDFVTKPINFGDLDLTIKKTLAEITTLRDAYLQKAAAQRERGQLARYFSPAIIKQLLADPSPLKLGVDRREMSFVFTDLAGFTPFIEKSESSAIVALLNDYFGGMVEIAFNHEGTVEKVVGDGINVFFSAPMKQPDHAERALACSLDMDEFAREFAREQRSKGIRVGETRIGVNTGEALVGNFGCEALMHYTAHGDVVNTTARLQSANRYLGTHVCVSATTSAAVPGFAGLPVGELILKGKSQHVMVFQPYRAEQVKAPFTEEYLAAYALLENSDERALEEFTTIVEKYPDAHLAAYHLYRLRKGDSGIQINIAT